MRRSFDSFVAVAAAAASCYYRSAVVAVDQLFAAGYAVDPLKTEIAV